MQGKLTTHVLDTAGGIPAAGVRIELFRLDAGAAVLLKTVTANRDGRSDEALLADAALVAGTYRLVFHIGEYFRSRGHADAGKFLDQVPVEFNIVEGAGSYHVPLLISPWSYSTYRGS